MLALGKVKTLLAEVMAVASPLLITLQQLKSRVVAAASVKRRHICGSGGSRGGGIGIFVEAVAAEEAASVAVVMEAATAETAADKGGVEGAELAQVEAAELGMKRWQRWHLWRQFLQ